MISKNTTLVQFRAHRDLQGGHIGGRIVCFRNVTEVSRTSIPSHGGSHRFESYSANHPFQTAFWSLPTAVPTPSCECGIHEVWPMMFFPSMPKCCAAANR